jgi:DoxX-like family
MKKNDIIFWVTTGIIFLFEGVLVALTSQTELAKEGIRHLQYPAYFGGLLAIFKVAGALALFVPQVPPQVKEWAYVGFGFNFIWAAYSHGMVDGLGNFQTWFPLIFLGLLVVSYVFYHKRRAATVVA